MAQRGKEWQNLGRSRTLSQLYVYYERLNDPDESPENKALYASATDSLARIKDNAIELSKSSDLIHGLAQKEAEKEQKFVSEQLGQKFRVDFKDHASIKYFIETLNSITHIREVYERNIATIKNSKGQKSVISFFPTYYIHALDNHWEEISQKTSALFGKDNRPIDECLQEAIDSINDSVLIPEAVHEMLQAKPELASLPDEMQNAYKEVLQILENPNNANPFYQKLKSIYQLDKLTEQIKASLFQTNKQATLATFEKSLLSHRKKTSGKGVANPLLSQLGARGGLTLEAFEELVLKSFVEKNGGIAFNAGGHNFKVDNVAVYGIDPTPFQEVFEATGKDIRKADIEANERLYQKVRGKKGTVLYYTDKNYSLNEDFERRFGFSAGAPISAETYDYVMGKIAHGANSFTGAILQTAKGAIGGEDLKKDLSGAMAQQVAMMLFSDYQTIGDGVDSGGLDVLHLMNLGGVVIPFSVFLEMFAQAIDDAQKDPTDFVKVDISSPVILYPTKESQLIGQAGGGPMVAWRKQREDALARTKISFHFWKTFRQFVIDYL